MTVETRYLDGTYLAHNPEWDCSDAPWKAARVAEILKRNGISPTSICDVGCGSGHILAELRGQFPDARLYGFDRHLEEAAMDGIPVIAIDPKGDLGNLLLTFPG